MAESDLFDFKQHSLLLHLEISYWVALAASVKQEHGGDCQQRYEDFLPCLEDIFSYSFYSKPFDLGLNLDRCCCWVFILSV